ncbi:MAG: acylneuraminate cytidylyltransferase family protein [Patescibacteria group bacterium]|nr:acylneuraminate cytidylyltransferase family protein [Patescibacteria group bacterium]
MNILGVIPARGGSKSVPRKNIRDLGGKPLIAWTIEAAHEAAVLERLIVSTDDPEIAMISRRWEVEVPFLRPKELARDDTPALSVLQHAVEHLRTKERYEPEAIMLLQPTAPLRTAAHIREAVSLFTSSGADSVVSVVEIPGHLSPYWAVVEDGEGNAQLFTGGPISSRIPRRQEFPASTYAHNGAIYLFKTGLLFDSTAPSLYGRTVRLYKMDASESINIDGPEDWAAAEAAIAS